jgi:hypothetical protein
VPGVHVYLVLRCVVATLQYSRKLARSAALSTASAAAADVALPKPANTPTTSPSENSLQMLSATAQIVSAGEDDGDKDKREGQGDANDDDDDDDDDDGDDDEDDDDDDHDDDDHDDEAEQDSTGAWAVVVTRYDSVYGCNTGRMWSRVHHILNDDVRVSRYATEQQALVVARKTRNSMVEFEEVEFEEAVDAGTKPPPWDSAAAGNQDNDEECRIEVMRFAAYNARRAADDE